MTRKYFWQLGVLVVLLALIAGIFTYVPGLSRTAPVPPATQQAGHITLTVPNLYTGESLPITTDETALALLQQLDKSNPNLKLVTKEYAGLGSLVDSMVGLKNGTDGKYWSYYVNGEMAQVGAGAYVLKNADKVEWKFSKLEQ